MILPAYTLRFSKKAKYLQLRVFREGLEVVVPVRAKISNNEIEHFINQKRAWIERHLTKINKEKNHEESIQQVLPTAIHLQAFNEHWEIIYLPTNQRSVKLITNMSQQITIIGKVDNKETNLRLLRNWLLSKAKYHLQNEIDRLVQKTGLTYNELSIRNNTTRWGSCSSNKDISLCCKLLFVPTILMQHILLHELCHTKVMHHGKRFWQLLEKFDPNARMHAKQLRTMNQFIPTWV